MLKRGELEKLTQQHALPRPGVGYPFNTACLPLTYTGNPGVHGVSHRGGTQCVDGRVHQEGGIGLREACGINPFNPRCLPLNPSSTPGVKLRV